MAKLTATQRDLLEKRVRQLFEPKERELASKLTDIELEWSDKEKAEFLDRGLFKVNTSYFTVKNLIIDDSYGRNNFRMRHTLSIDDVIKFPPMSGVERAKRQAMRDDITKKIKALHELKREAEDIAIFGSDLSYITSMLAEFKSKVESI